MRLAPSGTGLAPCLAPSDRGDEGGGDSGGGEGSMLLIGFAMMTASSLGSSFAGVYNEFLLKSEKVPLHHCQELEPERRLWRRVVVCAHFFISFLD